MGNIIRKIIAFMMAVVLVMGTISIDSQAASKKKAVKSICVTNLETKTLVLKPKKTFKLKTKVTVSGKASKKVTYSSSNKKVATVNKKGKIKAVKKGTAKITVKSVANKKKKVTIKVIVGTPVKKITLNKKSAKAYVGDTIKLKAAISPKKPSVKKLEYSSSNTSVAKVNSKGVITCLAEGKAKITVTATDGSGKKAVCNVTVQKKKNEEPTTEKKQDNATTETKKPDKTTTEDKKSDDDTTEAKKDLSYSGYQLKWMDDFEETALNTDNWNVETHEPGWVNSELQEYVDSTENIYVKDGNLIIKPIKTVDEEGNVSYTSGRVNTQNKQDFTYGLFEVRAKVPEGQGYLPAFWMMPTNENLYGQWPRCGEIDIMEVMGQENNKAYGTIHYGNPHSESQGTYVLSQGNYTNSYHVFSCEWEPGKIKWYVDGVLYHEESDWYSTTVGQGTVSYPAPFDQPFYMILNLAVGGSWVGNPNEDTDFENQAFVIDYVKAYQKDSYDENVSRPEKDVVLRDPDADGNYVNNGNFAIAESLTDDNDWKFMTALEGVAEAGIEDNSIKVATTNAGTVDYSVQLVQAGIPLEKGATYTVSFDARATAARTMKTAIKGPDYGYSEYMTSKTVDLTTEKQTYIYEFKMTSDSDANGRLEFNMGAAGSTEDIYISNVSIKKTQEANPDEKEEKTILADGNYVYNGSFQEGEGRLGYWEITNNVDASVSVTNANTDRKLKVTVDNDDSEAGDVLVAQSDLAIKGGGTYALSFDAQADSARDMKIVVAGQELTASLTEENRSYTFKITIDEELTDRNIVFYMGEKGTIYLDNVRLVEDALIKNGSFNAGFAGYEWYVDSSADATNVVDSLNEDNAADFTIKDTGDQDWKIQLKQNNVELEKGQWYKLSFKAKSSLQRKIRVIMQGTEAKNWAVYSGENTVTLDTEYQTFEKTFQMTAATDTEAFLSICLGKIDERISTQHRVCIDDIVLEKVEAPDTPEIETGVNILKNGDFSDGNTNWENAVTSPGEAAVSFDNNKAVYAITNVGNADWNVQLKQNGIMLEKNCKYKISFKACSTEARIIKLAMLSSTYAWYGGGDITLEKDVEKDVVIEFTMDADTDSATTMVVSMGQIFEEDNVTEIDTPASTITLSDFVLEKVDIE